MRGDDETPFCCAVFGSMVLVVALACLLFSDATAVAIVGAFSIVAILSAVAAIGYSRADRIRNWARIAVGSAIIAIVLFFSVLTLSVGSAGLAIEAMVLVAIALALLLKAARSG